MIKLRKFISKCLAKAISIKKIILDKIYYLVYSAYSVKIELLAIVIVSSKENFNSIINCRDNVKIDQKCLDWTIGFEI